jgi:hypothetical protein
MTPRILILLIPVILVSCGSPAKPMPPTAPATGTATQVITPTKIQHTATLRPTDVPIWRPAPGVSWQWQLDTPVDTSIDAQVFDIDLFDNDASVVAALHEKGAKVICYTSVGSREDWRPDAGMFPPDVVGRNYPDWEGEKFLDIRQIDKLAPIMLARMDLCKAKGFDGIEPDNIDIYDENTGFPLTFEDQLEYNRWLSTRAHERGLSIGLKNDPDQVRDLVNEFDWALAEDCFYENWCDQIMPFIATGKAVFASEYTDTGITLDKFCPKARELKFSAIIKNRDLDAFRRTCPEN